MGTSKIISAVLESCQGSPFTDEPSTQRLRIAQLVGGDDRRAHGREAVGPLGPQPLAVLALKVAHRDVVEDRVSEDGVHGLRANRPATPAAR